MSRKTRQTVTMIALCVLLVAAGVGYYALIKYQSSGEETKEQEGISLYEMDDSKIVSLRYKNQKADMELVKENNVWKMEGDKKFPLNQNKISLMVDEVAAVSADQMVTDKCDDLKEYQLDEPDLTVEVEDSDGNRQELVIGMESISGGGRYAYCGDSSRIYILSTSIYTSFDYTSGQIMETEELPSVTADYVTGLKIAAGKGKDFEVVYDEKHSSYEHMDGWTMNAPYSQPVAADAEQLRTLFENYSSLFYSEGVTYDATAAQLKKYGLDKPSYKIILDYFEVKGEASDSAALSETTASAADSSGDSSGSTKQKKTRKRLSLSIGKMNQDKTGYYAQAEGDEGVYLMETSTVESLVNITPLQYVYQQLYVGDLANLESVDVKYQGKSHRITIQRKKAVLDNKDTDTEGDTLTVKIDGKEADTEQFQAAYDLVTNLPPNGEIDSGVKPESEESVAELTFHEKERDVVMTFYPYDGKNFYRIKVNGVMQFVTDMRNVDHIMDSFVALGRS